MPLITLGDATKLQLKVPSKGDTNWENDFKNEFAQKIVEHDHTGADGKGIKISEAAIEDGAITTAKIADGAITSIKIAADAVADIDLAPNSVGDSELKPDAVRPVHIMDGAVNTDKLFTGAVRTDKIFDAQVTEAKLATDSVSTSKIVDSNVTEAKLATDSVSTNKIVDANVTTAKIADSNVTAAKIGSDVVLSTLNDVSSATPSAGQVLKWDGSSWGPGTDASSAGSGTIIISNQTDADAYTPSSGDKLLITGAADLSSKDLKETNIFIQTPSDVTFGNLASCDINGGYSLFFEKNVQGCRIVTTGSLYVSNTSYSTAISRCSITCNLLSFNVDNTASKDIVVSNIFCNSIASYGSTGGGNKISLYNSNIECANYNINPSFADVKMNVGSKLTIKNSFVGKIYNSAYTSIIIEKSTTLNLAFQILQEQINTLEPIAAHYQLTTSHSIVSLDKIQYNTTTKQTGGITLDANYNVVIPIDGWYSIHAGVYVELLDNANDNARISWRIRRNTFSLLFNQEAQIQPDDHVQDSGSVLYYLEEGDLIDVIVQTLNDVDNTVTVQSSIANFIALHRVN